MSSRMIWNIGTPRSTPRRFRCDSWSPRSSSKPESQRLESRSRSSSRIFSHDIGVLTGDGYRDHIEEVRIEGHTSSEWEESSDPLQAYLGNMVLSQGRTFEVLSYVAGLSGVWDPWLKERLTANGLSSSRLVLNNGIEDRTASRRVEFRVRTDAEEQIARIRSMGR